MKTRILKSLISIVLAVIMIASITAFSVSALDVDDNNSIEKAEEISVGTTIKSAFGSSGSDYYMFEVDDSGYFQFTFDSQATQIELNLYKFDNTLQLVFGQYVFPDDGFAVLPEIGVDSGMYYLELNPLYYDNRLPYNLTVGFTKTDYWELAMGDSILQAKNMELDQQYGGFIDNSSDEDYFRIEVEENGYFNFTLSHKYIYPDYGNKGWIFELYKYTNRLELVYSSGFRIDIQNEMTPPIGVDPGVYYIKLTSDGYSKALNVTYQLLSNFTKTDYWELAIGNSPSNSKVMQFDHQYGGSLSDSKDKDYFKINLENKKYFEIDFERSMSGSTYGDYSIEIYKLSNSYDKIYSEVVDVNQTSLKTTVITLEPGTYYLKISLLDADIYSYNNFPPDPVYHVSLNSALPFTDVLKNEYYYESVQWAVESEITNGISETTFSPEDTCTRGQIVTFLWRAAGSPEPTSQNNVFTDVKADDYYYKAVLWAVENGITNGTTKTTFDPDGSCTRSQAVTFLWRYEDEEQINADNIFTDVPAYEYYTNAVLWAVENKITNGTTNTTFEPNTFCTRGHIVTFLYRDIAE